MFDDFTTQIQCEEVNDEAMYEAWLEVQEELTKEA